MVAAVALVVVVGFPLIVLLTAFHYLVGTYQYWIGLPINTLYYNYIPPTWSVSVHGSYSRTHARTYLDMRALLQHTRLTRRGGVLPCFRRVTTPVTTVRYDCYHYYL